MLSFFKEIRIYLGIIFLLIGSLIALMYFSLPKGLEEFSLSLPADEEIKYERETIKYIHDTITQIEYKIEPLEPLVAIATKNKKITKIEIFFEILNVFIFIIKI